MAGGKASEPETMAKIEEQVLAPLSSL